MICYEPIGVVRSPHKDIQGMPIQPVGALGVAGCIELNVGFQEGLKDLEGFSHLIVLYHFHASAGYSLRVKPFLDTQEHGVFATRAPRRPNPIGLSVLELVRVEGSTLHLKNVDILDGTPVLDIKPYVPAFDVWNASRVGWLEEKIDDAATHRADARFR